jgi:hypothetical protein
VEQVGSTYRAMVTKRGEVGMVRAVVARSPKIVMVVEKRMVAGWLVVVR